MRTLLLIILLSTALNTVILPQIASTSEKERIISELDSLDSWTRYGAINEIKTYKIKEAIPKLLENLWIQKEPGIAFNFLECLYILDYPNIVNLTYSFIDSLNNYDYDLYSAYTPQELKIMAIDILFKKGDYTQAGYFFSFIQSTPNYIQIPRSIGMLGNVLLNDPEYADQAKTELLKIAFEKTKDSASKHNSQYALLYLQEALGPDIVSVLEKIFQDPSNSFALRIFCMNILSKERKNNLADIYKTQIVVDTNKVFQVTLIKEMLKVLGTPDIVAFIDSYLKNVENEWIKKIVTYQLKDFVPQQDSTLNIEAAIDSLIVYTNQLYYYNWLIDTAYKNELIVILQSARNYLLLSDSADCAKKVKSFQSSIQQAYSDSAGSYPKYVSEEAYKFLYYYPQYILERLPPIPSIKLKDSWGNLLPGGSLQYYDGGWKNATDNGDGTFSVDTQLKTVSLRMTYGYASQTKSNISVASDTVVFQTVNTAVKLLNSRGIPLDTGTVQYYAGGWRDFGKTENGTAYKELLPVNYTFRMNYGFADSDKAQSLDTNSTVVFNTVNASVRLQNSSGNPMDEGTVLYYAGGWRPFGTTVNGVIDKELLPNNYTFRMNYAFAGNDKQQNIKDNPIVLFQTVNAGVQLKDSKGNPTDPGTVQYYSGGWRNFGTTSNGIARKELLPNNYTFRMSYAFSSKDKQQNIGTNPLVEFQTVNAEVQLRNSQNNLIDGGMVQYYSGGWRDFGAAAGGIANKELLANNYTFRVNYAFASNDKAQDLNANPVVVFNTVNTIAELRNSAGSLIDEGTVQYYAGGWRSFGTTIGGSVSKELLPNNYTFRMTHDFISNDKAQNTNTNSTVSFSTVQCTIRVMDSQNQPVSGAAVSYYSGGWRSLGTTLNGLVTREMLPANLTFRVSYNGTQQDKTQNLLNSSIVEFIVGQ